MTRYILRRLIIIPIALLLVHFLAFAYAYVARPLRAARTPYYLEQTESAPLLETYTAYLRSVAAGESAEVLPGQEDLTSYLAQATRNSLALLILALTTGSLIGLGIGMQAVRVQPPGVRHWITVVSTVGLSMPSFYLGSLFIMGIVFYVLWRGPGTDPFFPIGGFGFDRHLLLPAITLMIHPAVKLGQVSAELLAGELNKQYVIAARSFGHTWRNIRWRQSMRNILAALILTIAASFRLMIGELIVVEWLFNWPGLGKLLASTLVPGMLSSDLGATAHFLNPPLVAAVVTIIAALFLIADLIASILVRIFDPRLRPQAGGDEA
jgi:peptide/nickel transport system permease protein